MKQTAAHLRKCVAQMCTVYRKYGPWVNVLLGGYYKHPGIGNRVGIMGGRDDNSRSRNFEGVLCQHCRFARQRQEKYCDCRSMSMPILIESVSQDILIWLEFA